MLLGQGHIDSCYWSQQGDREHEALVALAYKSGRHWAEAGNAKLPRSVTLKDREYVVVRSRTDIAQAFVRGWKEAQAK